MIKFLINKRARADAVNADGLTPRDVARIAAHKALLAKFSDNANAFGEMVTPDPVRVGGYLPYDAGGNPENDLGDP